MNGLFDGRKLAEEVFNHSFAIAECGEENLVCWADAVSFAYYIMDTAQFVQQLKLWWNVLDINPEEEPTQDLSELELSIRIRETYRAFIGRMDELAKERIGA